MKNGRRGFYHPRTLDHSPESHGVHVLICRGCGKRFEKIGMPDPDDPLDFYCGECLLAGRVMRIEIGTETKERLLKHRRVGQSFDDLLNELLDYYEEVCSYEG